MPANTLAANPEDEQDDLARQRQPSTVPSFLFISFVLWMLMKNENADLLAKHLWIDTLAAIHGQITSYSAWLNGTASNFTLPARDSTLMPLVYDFVSFGPSLDPSYASYYSNLTGFWRGDSHFHNLTNLTAESSESPVPPFWLKDVPEFVSNANLTNATELSARLGDWNWEHSEKIAVSFGDKQMWSEGEGKNLSKDIAMIHGKIDFTDSDSSEELRLLIEGVHFISNGSIYAFAESPSHGVDLVKVPSIVPEDRLNETGRIIEAELYSREAKLRARIERGNVEDTSDDFDGPKTGCSFNFYGQVQSTNVPQQLLQELEDEIDEPTGITTIRPPEMKLKGVLISKNCGILYELPELKGLKSHGLFRKIATYGGLSTLMNAALLLLLVRQAARSRSATGLSRVSRYPFIIQSLIDAISFVGHVTLAILAEGRTSISVLAPAGLACILFIYEAQFAILIGQIQASEDASPTRTTPPTAPQPTATTPPPNSGDNAGPPGAVPVVTVTPATTAPPTPATPPGLLRQYLNHIRDDPSARLWAMMSFFLLVVVRIVLALSIPLLFLGALYTCLWMTQIHRTLRRARTSGLAAEYLVGTTVCRLFYFLYFLACPKNILDVEPRRWAYGVASVVLFQVLLILSQNYFGPTFFLPKSYTPAETYDYHPPMPLPDPEAPEQSLGDCSICMEAIVVDPALRHRADEKESNGLTRRTTALWAQGAKKSYSLAPCHHLFHTACLERWLAIKNICPQCRRPLPPL